MELQLSNMVLIIIAAFLFSVRSGAEAVQASETPRDAYEHSFPQ
jgi:hypothetical protein